MKKIKGMVMRRLGNEAMIVAESIGMIDFDRLVSLNESAAYIWEYIGNNEFDIDTLSQLLTARYEVDKETAENDAKELVGIWLEAGIIES